MSTFKSVRCVYVSGSVCLASENSQVYKIFVKRKAVLLFPCQFVSVINKLRKKYKKIQMKIILDGILAK